MKTDFPEPVVPAISRCGIDVRSPIIGVPEILFPKAIGSLISFLENFAAAFKFAIETAKIEFAPKFDLFSVPSKFINILSISL